MSQKIEIMDTTLRDGEQTDGVSFSAFEKLQIARFLLEKLNVNRIEVASARVSAGEQESVKAIFDWAKGKDLDKRIEILGFVDHRASVDWIQSAGGSVINLLTKGSRKHCELQLGKNLSEHIADIERTVTYASDQGVTVNVYLEDWSNGFLHSPDYVLELLRALRTMPVHRFLFPDTLGIMSPDEVKAGISHALNAYPELAIDFHGHNDYGLATANCLAAVQSGVKGVHVAVNGLGERAGNAPLEAVVTALHDKLGVETSVVEAAITDASRLVETFSRKRISSNRPIVGTDVFTQTAGIHADGDKKHNLYANPILPERFGRQRVYALGKLAGKASVANNLTSLGIELPPEQEKALLEKIKELGERKETVTADDLPFLIEDLFGGLQTRFVRITDIRILTEINQSPSAELALELDGKEYRASSSGDGGYDAFMNALGEIASQINLILPELVDYEVRIPPGGKTDALVETVITWKTKDGASAFRTVGVDSDQMIAAVKATEKMLNRLFIANPAVVGKAAE
ncbi:MAG: 2-isopropylmalate synthase [Spirochaetaceae bacterium]|nr:2-isopropylmalate synthase [Spirochaetaceae bacterium]|tara:strand:+ start:309317 stop:310870 length:1554 start_codon:yes stop_codon:yes gene_type:complete